MLLLVASAACRLRCSSFPCPVASSVPPSSPLLVCSLAIPVLHGVCFLLIAQQGACPRWRANGERDARMIDGTRDTYVSEMTRRGDAGAWVSYGCLTTRAWRDVLDALSVLLSVLLMHCGHRHRHRFTGTGTRTGTATGTSFGFGSGGGGRSAVERLEMCCRAVSGERMPFPLCFHAPWRLAWRKTK